MMNCTPLKKREIDMIRDGNGRKERRQLLSTIMSRLPLIISPSDGNKKKIIRNDQGKIYKGMNNRKTKSLEYNSNKNDKWKSNTEKKVHSKIIVSSPTSKPLIKSTNKRPCKNIIDQQTKPLQTITYPITEYVNKIKPIIQKNKIVKKKRFELNCSFVSFSSSTSSDYNDSRYQDLLEDDDEAFTKREIQMKSLDFNKESIDAQIKSLFQKEINDVQQRLKLKRLILLPTLKPMKSTTENNSTLITNDTGSQSFRKTNRRTINDSMPISRKFYEKDFMTKAKLMHSIPLYQINSPMNYPSILHDNKLMSDIYRSNLTKINQMLSYY